MLLLYLFTTKKFFLERVAERVSSLSKLKSVLVTDSHAQLLQRPCSATYGHEQRRRRLPSSSGGPRGREGRRARRGGGHARGGGGGSREQD